MSASAILAKNGLVNADAITRAAARVGVPLHIAAAFAEQESGGRNVYGNDVGGAMRGGGLVTRENFTRFLQLISRKGAVSNGVGPFQITYKGYFPQAAAQGLELWRVEDNAVFGLGIIKASLAGRYDDDSINRAAQRYNSGRPDGAPQYGKSVVARAKKWKALLEPAPLANPLGLKPATVKTLQSRLGVMADGDFGARSVTALQLRLKSCSKNKLPGFPAIAADGVVGPATVKAIQLYLTALRRAELGTLTTDGKLGPKTSAALETYIARLNGRFS